MSYLHIDAVIRRAVQLGVIRLDHQLPNQLDRRYVQGLKDTAALLERIRHGLTIRKMMYDHADICQEPLNDQLALYPSKSVGLKHTRTQNRGLTSLQQAAAVLPTEEPDRLHNPNIIVNCDSGTDGELGCELGYIKVYQAIFSASYGANNYKDVFEHNHGGHRKIIIHPAAGGKCNVSIGNPFRIVGWYLNYMNQGAKAPLVRMWEIPSKYFIETLLRYCGTEKQIKDKANKEQYFVEMCDHRASNQFGIWTHKEVPVPYRPYYTDDGKELDKVFELTKVGKEFLEKSRRLVTYYDPQGTHVPSKQDGECRDVRRLLTHLGISTRLTDRFHDFGMSLSDATGNLTMTADAAANDQRLLQVIELVQSSASDVLARVARLDRESVRTFVNLLSYNKLNPQQFNTSSRFTRTGLDVQNLRRETLFMAQVYTGNPWHFSVRHVVGKLKEKLDALELAKAKPNQKADEAFKLKPDVKASLPGMCVAATTYNDVFKLILAHVGNVDFNVQIIDALNGVLRPLCDGGNVLKLVRSANQHDNFQVSLLGDLRFEVGISHRDKLHAGLDMPDSLDGHKGGGFVQLPGFEQPLDKSVQTSNTTVQLNLHAPLIDRMHERGIPVMGGISGTTRDIFTTLHSLFGPNDVHHHWQFFSVVAAFMIKHHYHSLVECFIAAYQIRKTGNAVLPCNSAEDFYRIIQSLTKVPLLTPA